MEDQIPKEQRIHPITEALHKIVDKFPLFLKFSETKENAVEKLRSIGHHSRPLTISEESAVI